MELKTIEDYIPRLKEEFPYLTESDILNILKFGFKRYAKAKAIGCDVMIRDNSVYKILAFTGFLTSDSLLHYRKAREKRRHKRRYFYEINKTEWDGTYYFGVGEKDVDKLEAFIKNEYIQELKLNNIVLYMFEEDVEERVGYKILCKVDHDIYRFFSHLEKKYVLRKNRIRKIQYINYE